MPMKLFFFLDLSVTAIMRVISSWEMGSVRKQGKILTKNPRKETQGWRKFPVNDNGHLYK